MPSQRRCAYLRLSVLLSLDSAYLHPLSMRIGKTYSKYLREILTFISLRSTYLATHQIPPRTNNPGPDTWPRLRFHQGTSRAQTQIPPRETLGPRRLGLIPPRRKRGPRYSGPGSARKKPRAKVLGAKFPRIDLPCPRQSSSCPFAPISPSLGHHLSSPCYRLAPSINRGRYRHGLTSIASCCRSLREASWGFPPYLALKSSLATRWPDAMESSVGIAQRMRRGINWHARDGQDSCTVCERDIV